MLVFDVAIGTSIHARRLTPADFGGPGLEGCNDHERLFRLLAAQTELAMRLTAAFQLVPEQSTAALVVHHPDARYFVNLATARPSRAPAG